MLTYDPVLAAVGAAIVRAFFAECSMLNFQDYRLRLSWRLPYRGPPVTVHHESSTAFISVHNVRFGACAKCH